MDPKYKVSCKRLEGIPPETLGGFEGNVFWSVDGGVGIQFVLPDGSIDNLPWLLLGETLTFPAIRSVVTGVIVEINGGIAISSSGKGATHV